MDKIEKYRQAIRTVLKNHHSGKYEVNYDEYEPQLVLDDESRHYFLMGVGWNKYKRIHGITIHIDLKKGKVWVQQDWTDSIVVDQLMELGIDKEDIVLGFQAPYKRKHTGFAVA